MEEHKIHLQSMNVERNAIWFGDDFLGLVFWHCPNFVLEQVHIGLNTAFIEVCNCNSDTKE